MFAFLEKTARRILPIGEMHESFHVAGDGAIWEGPHEIGACNA
jgi:hypothetical protein